MNMNFKEFITQKKSIIIICTFEAVLFILFFILWIANANVNKGPGVRDTDVSNAATIEHAISAALNEYVSVKNSVSAGNTDIESQHMINSIKEDSEIVNYIRVSDILAAVKSDKNNKNSWEYLVYKNISKFIIEDNDKPVLYLKKDDTDFFVKISGSTEKGYEVRVTPAKEDPFSKER